MHRLLIGKKITVFLFASIPTQRVRLSDFNIWKNLGGKGIKAIVLYENDRVASFKIVGKNETPPSQDEEVRIIPTQSL